MNITIQKFADIEQISYQTCAYRIRRHGIEPVAFNTGATTRGVKAFLFNYDDLLKIKSVNKQVIKEGTTTLRNYAKQRCINYKALYARVYLSNLEPASLTPSVTGGGRKAGLYLISDLDDLYRCG